MDINEQIKAAENLIWFTQDYLAIKKLLKTAKTALTKSNLEKIAETLSKEIKKYMEVI